MSAIKNISLFIPHVFANYGKEDVTKVFEDLNIGKISHIDFVSKLGNDGKLFNAAYVHFEHWYDNIVALNFQERVLNPNKQARIVYEDPWYWIVLENKANKVKSGDRKIRINIAATLPLENIETPPTTPTYPLENVEPDIEMELEAAIKEEEEMYLTSVDSRYIEAMEQENIRLREQIGHLENVLGQCTRFASV